MINYVGGERALIVMMHGRAPVSHLWPLNHVLPKIDISDPYTFLAIKRGILQYTWLKPILALATIIMKLCGVYQEGYIGVSSGYFWSGIIYNISVTVSLYALGLFWICMHHDLKPFRPVPKFLSIKLIIFASYWQGFFLSILVWLGAIPDDVQGYTPDNLAAAIQDALICLEMPAFAVAHWYAFSWKDFANNDIQSARMPLEYAFRDAFGPKDLIEDSKQTFGGQGYGYRIFDSGDKIMAHEDSRSRIARLDEGMRYERGGKGKYWIPKPGQAQAQISANTPLLAPAHAGSSSRTPAPQSPLGLENGGTFDEELGLDPDEERLYGKARELEYGDWNVSCRGCTLRRAG
ncbi:OSTA/TMEM184 family protein [Candidatus Bathyarchaeota archaeon]|nr:OSTA/TMEM184 family protein [Candidatus Bathyarchaeota archaeon]